MQSKSKVQIVAQLQSTIAIVKSFAVIYFKKFQNVEVCFVPNISFLFNIKTNLFRTLSFE